MKKPPLLSLNRVSKTFGGLVAVNDLNLEVSQGYIFGLIGPNGAGKTTVFNLITGVYPCAHGSIRLEDSELTILKPYRIARLGISRTFQTIRLFPNMTTWEHVLIGQNFLSRPRLGGILPLQRAEEFTLREQAQEALKVLGLWEMKERRAVTLPYGSQRKVEIARALAARPKLLLLDEPTAGMNAREKEDVLNALAKIHDFGVTILVIEHDMRVVMGLCDHIFVLNFGQKIAEGTPSEIRKNEEVLEAYLGQEE
ncbi:MAG: ABC transporter ATP-binding protein [Deltaproteobacteria bacterium]|nr:ABC transporter ATP-binding protein [Deltaproteobacteria bacterium]